MTNNYKKTKKRKKEEKEKEKNNNQNLSGEEKMKLATYTRNYYLAHKK